MNYFKSLVLGAALASCAVGAGGGEPDAPVRPNFLFIAVDDWKAWAGAFGTDWIKTPNFDRLARRGVLFTNAHCPAPVCGPSRTATLTGMAPTRSGVYDNHTPFRVEWPERKTMPQLFRQAGYDVAGAGKLFHHDAGFNDRRSWTRYFFWNPQAHANGWWERYAREPDPEPVSRPATPVPATNGDRNFDWAPLPVSVSDMPDGKVARWAATYLENEWRAAPFFLAVGLFRPHWPWYLPAEYFDRLPLDGVQLPKVLTGDLEDIPPVGRALARAEHHDQIVKLGVWREAVRAYAASIEFMDDQLGEILDALEKSPHRESTIVVLWSDHGYHLGEKGRWGKQTLWREATQVPMILAGPKVPQGVRRDEAVSLLDIFPTLLELSGLASDQPQDGHSLVPLLTEASVEWPNVAITTHGRGNHAVRDRQYALIRYVDGSEELYDHIADPQEWVNLVAQQEYREVVDRLRAHLPSEERPRGPDWRSDVQFDPVNHQWLPRP